MELIREEVKTKMIEILNFLVLEEAKNRSEAEHLFMMNHYGFYKFIDAKSESLRSQ